MATFDYPILAREGRVHLIVSLACGIVATLVWGWWSIPVWLLVLFVFQFFRDPQRQITDEPGTVVAPASGQVVFIGEMANPYLEGVTSLKVSIFFSNFSKIL